MKFGIREVCDVVFNKIEGSGEGPTSFIIDTAKMSSIEGAATTVYAQGGQGNSRLMAWEGDKTITFTVEDALISLDSFHALTGASRRGNTFTVKANSFAACYEVSAETLFRDEDNIDHHATIIIPKAKLQSNFNLSMSPTGDPSTFTFTFDALAVDDTLFSLTISDIEESDVTTKTTVIINGITRETETQNPTLAVSTAGAVTLSGATTGFPTSTVKVDSDEILTNGSVGIGQDEDATLRTGSSSIWYVV